jgi:hypothetical protein
MKRYSPTGRRNHGRPLKRLLEKWDRNGSTSGPTPWHIDDDDDDWKATTTSIRSIARKYVSNIRLAQDFYFTSTWVYIYSGSVSD